MKLNKIALAFALLGSLCTAQLLRADIVQNGDFSNAPSLTAGGKETITNAGLVDWGDYNAIVNSYNEVYISAHGDTDQAPFAAADPGAPPSGNVLEFTNDGIIYQTLNLTPGTTYDVSFYQAMTALDTTTEGPMTGFFDVYWNGLVGGGTYQTALAPVDQWMNTATTDPVPWNKRTVSFTADSTSAILAIEGYDDISANTSGIFLANVSVTAETTPLPPALPAALVTFVGIGAIAWARKSKRIPALARKIA